jgi:hypothetical protein
MYLKYPVWWYARVLCLEHCDAMKVHIKPALRLAVGPGIKGLDHFRPHSITARPDGGPHAHVNMPCPACMHEQDSLFHDPFRQSPPARMYGCNHRCVISPQKNRYAVRSPYAEHISRIMGYDPVGLRKNTGRNFLGPDEPV